MSKSLFVDNTASLYESSKETHLTGGDQYKLGEVGLFRGRKFVLLTGKQYTDPFARKDGISVDVFKYRALMLDRFGKSTGVVDGVKLSDLVKLTFGKCERGEDGTLLPYPKVETDISKNNYRIPKTFGNTTLNCGWNIRKKFVGTLEDGTKIYDGVIEEPQAFEVVDMEFHYTPVYDNDKNVCVDAEGYVEMRPRLVAIIQKIDMPEGLEEIVKAAGK